MAKEFIIPVSWEVYSTIKVEAETLEEAVLLAEKYEDVIPLCRNPEYIDGSYQMDTEDLEEKQDYQSIGNVIIDKNGPRTV